MLIEAPIPPIADAVSLGGIQRLLLSVQPSLLRIARLIVAKDTPLFLPQIAVAL